MKRDQNPKTIWKVEWWGITHENSPGNWSGPWGNPFVSMGTSKDAFMAAINKSAGHYLNNPQYPTYLEEFKILKETENYIYAKAIYAKFNYDFFPASHYFRAWKTQ